MWKFGMSELPMGVYLLKILTISGNTNVVKK